MSTNGVVSAKKAKEMLIAAASKGSSLTIQVEGATRPDRGTVVVNVPVVGERRQTGTDEDRIADVLGMLSGVARECSCGGKWSGVDLSWDPFHGTVSIGAASPLPS